MTDLMRRTLIHLLDGQQLVLAVMGDTDTRVVAAATSEWLDTAKGLRGELEDHFPDEFPDDQPIPFTIVPGVN